MLLLLLQRCFLVFEARVERGHGIGSAGWNVWSGVLLQQYSRRRRIRSIFSCFLHYLYCWMHAPAWYDRRKDGCVHRILSYVGAGGRAGEEAMPSLVVSLSLPAGGKPRCQLGGVIDPYSLFWCLSLAAQGSKDGNGTYNVKFKVLTTNLLCSGRTTAVLVIIILYNGNVKKMKHEEDKKMKKSIRNCCCERWYC